MNDKREPVRFEFPMCYRTHMYRDIPECWSCDIHKLCKRKTR